MPITTLVTGANGFVGATIVDLLLSPAYNHDKVILAVRRAEAADALIANNPSWPKDKLIHEIIPDFTAPKAFESVFQTYPDIDYVIHVAAPLIVSGSSDFERDYRAPNVAGVTELLASAKQHGKNVKAISVTGSINAITMGNQEDVKARAFTNDEWLPLGAEDAIKAQHGFISYCVGKKLAEQALWSFQRTESPHFTITNFLPPLIYGPMLQVVKDTKSINLSSAQLYAIGTSADSESGKVPATIFPGYIDVRDLAHLHILALTTPGAANKRFVVGKPLLFNDVAQALRQVPDKEISGRVGVDNDETGLWTLPRFGTEEVEKVFEAKGWGMRGLGETVADGFRSCLEIERREREGKGAGVNGA